MVSPINQQSRPGHFQTFDTPHRRPAKQQRALLQEGCTGDVLTQRYNNARTGNNACEFALSSGNVNNQTFGKLFCRPIDGNVFAQPLYATNVNVPNRGTFNAVIVATANNTLYAFDADNPDHDLPLWKLNFGLPVPTSVLGAADLGDQGVGILSTPVIDRGSNVIFAVSETYELIDPNNANSSRNITHRLHKVDLQAGTEIASTQIAATYKGNAPDSVNGVITFNSTQHIQRPGLLLDSGRVYLGFGSHGDQLPYHGWLLAYDAQSLNLLQTWVPTPDVEGGSIWLSGDGITADTDGDLYVVTGNGFSNATTPPVNDLSQSVVRLRYNASGFQVIDHFTPSNFRDLEAADLDLGATTPVLLPNSRNLVFAGKDGFLYELNRDSLGGFGGNGTEPLAKVQASADNVYSGPIYLQSQNAPQIYVWGGSDTLRGYNFSSSGVLSNTTDALSPLAPIPGTTFGGNLAGALDVVWATAASAATGHSSNSSGFLSAYNAADLSLLYDSDQTNGRDTFGTFAKFTEPTIANGKVFVGTFGGANAQLVAYGTLNPLSSGPCHCAIASSNNTSSSNSSTTVGGPTNSSSSSSSSSGPWSGHCHSAGTWLTPGFPTLLAIALPLLHWLRR